MSYQADDCLYLYDPWIRKQNLKLICSSPTQQFIEDISYSLTLAWYFEIPSFFKVNLICFLSVLGLQRAFGIEAKKSLPMSVS